MNYLPLAVGDGEIGGDSGVVEGSAEDGDFAEAVDVLLGDDSLADFAGETGEVEPIAGFKSLRERNADVSPAGALRFDFELVNAREIFRLDPEILVNEAGLVERDGVIAEQDRGWHGGGRGQGQRRAAGD